MGQIWDSKKWPQAMAWFHGINSKHSTRSSTISSRACHSINAANSRLESSTYRISRNSPSRKRNPRKIPMSNRPPNWVRIAAHPHGIQLFSSDCPSKTHTLVRKNSRRKIKDRWKQHQYRIIYPNRLSSKSSSRNFITAYRNNNPSRQAVTIAS